MMTAKESAIGVGICVFAILCILNREIITFVIYYVLPFAGFSFAGSIFLTAGVGNPDPEDTSLDYQSLAVRLFLVGVVSVLVISLADREYGKNGHVIRSNFSQGLNDSYNSLTESLEMGLGVFRPDKYEQGVYDGVTLLKIIALGFILGGSLISYASHGWYLPKQQEKKKEEGLLANEEKKENLRSDIYRLERIISDHEKEFSKRDIEIQSLRAENRSLKKKLGNPE